MTSVVDECTALDPLGDTSDDFVQSHLAKHLPLSQDSVGNELSTQKEVEGAVDAVLIPFHD